LRMLSNSFDVPRKAKFHAHTHVRGGDESDRLSWNRRALTAGGYGARFFVHTQLFAGHGKQPVNVLRFWRPPVPRPLMGRGQGGLTTVIFSGQNT
jgi:hypothetical protein